MSLVELLKSEPSIDSWQVSLKNAFRDSRKLADYLDLFQEAIENRPSGSLSIRQGTADYSSTEHRFSPQAARNSFPLFVTREFASRIRKGDWSDPLLRQVWIDGVEDAISPGFSKDPVGDALVEIAPGLLHKYHGRVLLIVTGACAIHCRYCFRRHYPYSLAPRSLEDWQPALDAISSDRSIKEVILSGGDPLSVVDSVLGRLIERLDRIPHLKRLRIHTRLPVVLPRRITAEFVEMLKDSRLSKWIVLHTNHANEIDEEVLAGIERLRASGAVLLNQSVLLRGVNDQLNTLVDLSERLMEARVIPYYLHHLDSVQGAAHFAVGKETGRHLIAEMAKLLPGFAVPKFVVEESGEPNKTLIR